MIESPDHPAVTRIVAIRHGETTWNAEQRLQGQLDIPLNTLGERQAAQLAGTLRGEGLHRVIASDLGRAWQTAQALAAPLGLPLEAEPGLRERCFGVLQGHTYAEIDSRWPDLARRWRTRDVDFEPEGGESLRQFNARCLGTLDRLAARYPGQSLAVVCHGGVLDRFHRAATHVALDLPRTWALGNAAINRLLHTPQGLALVGWNDDAHLDGLSLDESST